MNDFLAAVVVVLLVAFVVFLIVLVIIEDNEVDICQANGYVWCTEYADVDYCIRVEDERLIGVPLATVE